jgi:hypothetical protein
VKLVYTLDTSKTRLLLLRYQIVLWRYTRKISQMR